MDECETESVRERVRARENMKCVYLCDIFEDDQVD